MKICFITTMIFKDGGVSRVLSALASAFSNEYDVTVATFEKECDENRRKYNLSEEVRVDYRKPIYQKLYVRRLFHKINQKTGMLSKISSEALWRSVYIPSKIQQDWITYINSNKFEVVIGVQGKCAYILGSIADRLSCKTIGWQHNSYEAYLEQPGKNYYWNQDYLFEKFIPCLDYYVVLNEYDKLMFKAKKNIDCITIYNPRSFASKEKAELLNKRFIAVGGLRPAKGFDLLIQSFAIFATHDKEWKLDIYGDGDEYNSLKKLIEDYHLSNRVTLQGVTDNVRDEMLNSSALLLPSRWEGMPMVALEALETGLPIIAYNITAVEPLVINGIEGTVVDKFDIKQYAEAMLEISSDLLKRRTMGIRASEKSRQFDINNIVSKWKNLF